jgi:hypothetical protein
MQEKSTQNSHTPFWEFDNNNKHYSQDTDYYLSNEEVHYHVGLRYWVASIQIKGLRNKRKFLGLYATKEAAEKNVARAKRMYK